MQEMF